ncbi:hypothetical protein H1Q63_16965 [Desmonostoc muscorum CCALA 125]|nr:hypothetical protein [Desmonostoc muscorum CCALA 125]
MLKIARFFLPENNNNKTSINTAANLKTLPNHSSKVNYLKTFDTAVIAYYMMGFGNF